MLVTGSSFNSLYCILPASSICTVTFAVCFQFFILYSSTCKVTIQAVSVQSTFNSLYCIPQLSLLLVYALSPLSLSILYIVFLTNSVNILFDMSNKSFNSLYCIRSSWGLWTGISCPSSFQFFILYSYNGHAERRGLGSFQFFILYSPVCKSPLNPDTSNPDLSILYIVFIRGKEKTVTA